tara:strand:- start:1202 stop:1672 length:471 start_codon:yes stop_codon:yes gene_type:complete
MMTSFHFVPTEEIPYLWHLAKPLVDKVEEQANTEIDLTTQDHLDNLMSDGQSYRLVIGLEKEFSGDFRSLELGDVKSVVIAEVTDCPNARVLQILVWATKSLRDYRLWYDQFGTIEDFGREQSCTAVVALARPGLAKKLTQLSGWTVESIQVSKDL